MCKACIYIFFDKQTIELSLNQTTRHIMKKSLFKKTKYFFQSNLNNHKCLNHILLKDEQAYCLADEHERNEHCETQDLQLIFHTPQVPLTMELKHSHTKIEQYKRVTLQNKVQNTNFLCKQQTLFKCFSLNFNSSQRCLNFFT